VAASKSGKILDSASASSQKGKQSALGKRLFDRKTLRRLSGQKTPSSQSVDAKTLSRKSFRKHFRSQVTLAFADELEDLRQHDSFDARAAALVASAVDAWEAVVPETERRLAVPVKSKSKPDADK
jgi:hypothetical protein